MKELQATKTVGFGEKLGFCTFSGANNIVYQFKNLYYLFFLTNVVKLDIFWAGTIFTIGMLWDALNDPLIGYFAVNRRFKSGESVRPFALWYSIPWAATVVLLFTDFNAPDTLALEPSLELIEMFRPQLLPLVREMSGHQAFFSTAKAARMLGWTPKHSWRDYL